MKTGLLGLTFMLLIAGAVQPQENEPEPQFVIADRLYIGTSPLGAWLVAMTSSGEQFWSVYWRLDNVMRWVPNRPRYDSHIPPGEKRIFSDERFHGPSRDVEGLAWDGTCLWLSDKAEGRIYRVQTDGTVVGNFASPGAQPGSLAWDGSSLWNVDRETGRLYKLGVSGNVQGSYLLPAGWASGGIIWDGSSFWLSRKDGESILNVSTTGQVIGVYPAEIRCGGTGLMWHDEHIWVRDRNGLSVVKLRFVLN